MFTLRYTKRENCELSWDLDYILYQVANLSLLYVWPGQIDITWKSLIVFAKKLSRRWLNKLL